MRLLNALESTVRHVPVDREELNPKLFAGDRMLAPVRMKLLIAASEFYDSLGLRLKLLDVVLTGSNAQYVYGETSDVDVHIVADLSETGCEDIARKYLDAARSLWGIRHDVKIKGHPVEMYVEDEKTAPPSASYSLVRDEWVKRPVHEIPGEPSEEVTSRVREILRELESTKTVAGIKAALERLYDARKAGLRADGEASPDNLVFKTLRNAGVIDAMWRIVYNHDDERLSIPEALKHRHRKSIVSYPRWLRLG